MHIPVTTSKCHKKQIEFDKNKLKGTIGHLQQRPSCDDDGDFSPVVCIPGQMWVYCDCDAIKANAAYSITLCIHCRCYCADKKGERIFGEAIFSANIQLTMYCGVLLIVLIKYCVFTRPIMTLFHYRMLAIYCHNAKCNWY